MSTRTSEPEEHSSRETTLDAAPTWLDAGRIPSLDGLRALAVLLVIVSHWPFWPGGGVSAIKWRCGEVGVQLFFVISGFLITTLLLREVRRTGEVNLRQFYLRRTLRIVPVYLAYLAFVGLRQACGQLDLTGWNWFALLTYTGNFLGTPGNPQVWSLCVEEHFYLVWPLLLAFLPASRCRTLAGLAMVIAFGLRFLVRLTLADGEWTIYHWTPLCMDDLAVGCLLAYLARDAAWRKRLDRVVCSDGRLGLLLLAVLAVQYVSAATYSSQWFSGRMVCFLYSVKPNLTGLALGVFLWAALVRPTSWFGKLLNCRPAAAIGVLSYSLYLWHQSFLQHGTSSWLFAFPFNFIGMFLAAWLSYVLIEKPFLSLKDRLTAGRSRHLPSMSHGLQNRAGLLPAANPQRVRNTLPRIPTPIP